MDHGSEVQGQRGRSGYSLTEAERFFCHHKTAFMFNALNTKSECAEEDNYMTAALCKCVCLQVAADWHSDESITA